MNDMTLELMAQINFYSACLTFVVGNLVVFGFMRAAWASPRDPKTDPMGAGVRALGQAVFWGVGAYTWRMGYWDIFQRFFEPDEWEAIFRATGGQSVNVAWNLCRLWAAYQALLALLYLLPDEVRAEWRWWNVAFFPPWALTRCIIRAIRAVRANLRRLL